MASIAASLDPQLPPIRVHNVGYLRDEDEAVAFFEETVTGAAIVLVKLHGGVRSLPAFAELVRIAARERAWVVAMPGTDDLDPELTAYSTAGIPVSHEAKAYFQLGGLENVRQCLYFLSDHLLATGIGYAPPTEQPRSGVYHPRVPDGTLEAWRAQADPTRPTIGVTFYRAYWLIGRHRVHRHAGRGRRCARRQRAAGLRLLAQGRRAAPTTPDALRYFVDEDGRSTVDVVVNTMSFAMGSSSADERSDEEWAVDALRALDVPQLQAVNASVSSAEWLASEGGLSPLDVAMNVAIPELDGRIITVPLSFKEQQAGVEVGRHAGRAPHRPARPRRPGDRAGAAAGGAAPQAERREARRGRPDQPQRQGVAHRERGRAWTRRPRCCTCSTACARPATTSARRCRRTPTR